MRKTRLGHHMGVVQVDWKVRGQIHLLWWQLKSLGSVFVLILRLKKLPWLGNAYHVLYFQLTKSNMTWRIAYKEPTTTLVHIYVKKVEFFVLLHVPTAGLQYLSF